MTLLAAYLLLFVAVGVGFIFVHLVAGKLIRPNKPLDAKRTIYECGEPTIGSAWIQFDLRFYVVALLFVIFDVEVAFFFPWAVVFGKANTVYTSAQPGKPGTYPELADRAWELIPPAARSGPEHELQFNHLKEAKASDSARLKELADKRMATKGKLPSEEINELERLESNERTVGETRRQARALSWLALGEIAVFFGVLLVGYAYLWRRGDLAWVRSLAAERPTGEVLASDTPPLRPSALTPPSETIAHV